MTTHTVEQMHVEKMIHVTDIREGDLIDVVGWAWADEQDQMTAEHEYAVVGGEDGPYEVESDECVRIDFENFPSYGWPINRPITVQRRLNPIQETP